MFNSKFNKLYNLIMQDRTDQFLPRLKKYKVKHPDFDIEKNLEDLLSLPSKESKLACTLLVNDEIKSIDDKVFGLYKDILKSYPNIDINNYKQIKKLLDKQGEKNKNNQIQSIYKELDERFDCLTKKDQYDNDVIVYTIRDDRNAMRQIRQIVDAFKGNNTIVWCLVRRQANGDMDQGWANWIKYNAYPKQIAFQKGKLIGFNANESEQNLWWDIKDLQQKDGLKDLYGRILNLNESKPYSQEERDQLTLSQLKEIESRNGLYHTNGDVRIPNGLIVNGHIPLQFSYVGGNFICRNCIDLNDLKGFPTIIKKDLDLSGCTNLTNLAGAPERIEGEINTVGIEGIPGYKLKQWVQSYKI